MLYLGHLVGVSKVLTPRDNLLWSGHLRRQISADEIDAALAQVGLQGFEDSQCFTLSAGQHQRVSLARLLLSEARLWVLDEPFTTLDVRGVAFLENLMGQHSDQGGSVLVTTHHALAVEGLTELTLGWAKCREVHCRERSALNACRGGSCDIAKRFADRL